MVRALRAARRRWVPALGIVAVVVMTACAPGVAPTPALVARVEAADGLGAGILTPDGGDRYQLSLVDGVVRAAAPETNAGGNTRVGFWQSSSAWTADQQSCATWVDSESDLQQQGAALRVRTVGGRTTAITVTNNIYFYARWAFNVHVMDSTARERFRQIASFDLSEVFRPGGSTTYDVPPYPWRMCARVVGDTLSFIVWPLSHPEPSWDDPRYGGSVRVPAGWEAAGTPGWYVGHLEPGASVGFSELATAVVAPGPTPYRPRGDAGVVAPQPTTPPADPTWIARAP